MKRRYSGILVMTPCGRILCQLRDDIPGIICPGTWSCTPGGEIEEDETPEEAAVRELQEEFEIEVRNLEFLMTHEEKHSAYEGLYHAYFGELITPEEKVKCNEGQRVEFLFPRQALKLPQHPVSLLFLRSYLNRQPVK